MGHDHMLRYLHDHRNRNQRGRSGLFRDSWFCDALYNQGSPTRSHELAPGVVRDDENGKVAWD